MDTFQFAQSNEFMNGLELGMGSSGIETNLHGLMVSVQQPDPVSSTAIAALQVQVSLTLLHNDNYFIFSAISPKRFVYLVVQSMVRF